MPSNAKQALKHLNDEIDLRRAQIHEIATEQQGKSGMPDDLLLDTPLTIPPEHVAFFKRLNRHADLANLRSLSTLDLDDEATNSIGSLMEPLEMLTRTAIDVHTRASEGVSNVPQVRPEVRRETYSRLLQAKEMIDTECSGNHTVGSLAMVACLSHYHFLRLFKQVFDFTPHQYIIKKRLELACTLLTETDISVSEVSHKVGFESHGSFSTLFKRTFGIPPAQYRFQAAKKQIAK